MALPVPSNPDHRRPDSIASMLRWLLAILRRGNRPSRLEEVFSVQRPEVPPGRRRITTTVAAFDQHLAERRTRPR